MPYGKAMEYLDKRTNPPTKGYQFRFIWTLPDGKSLTKRAIALREDGSPYERLRDAKRWAKQNDELLKARELEKMRLRDASTNEQTIVLFKDIAKEFLEFKENEPGKSKDRKHKPSYLRSTPIVVNSHLVPFFGEMDIRTITPGIVDNFRIILSNKKPKSRGGDKLSVASINNTLTMLSMVFNFAQRHDPSFIPPHITRAIETTAEEDTEDKIDMWTPEEVDLLITRPPLKLRALTTIGIYLGLRAGEIAGLKWEDFNADLSEVIIKRSIVDRVEDLPKNGKNRKLPIASKLALVLRQLPRVGEYVLSNDNGSYLSYRTLQDWLAKAEAIAGLKPLGRLHKMKHTFCSLLALKNVPPTVIQELAAHSDIRTTMRYFHVTDDSKRNAVASL